jgi:3-oxoadipate enol-lactonase
MAPMYALQRQFMAIVGWNTVARLGEIVAPTLVLSGTADRVMPPQNARVLVEGIAGSRLVELVGAGHGFLVEKAEEVNAAVLGFLREHGAEAAAA